MTNFQKAIFTAVVVGSVGSAVYETRKASRLESGLRMLNEQHALLVAQIEQLKSERDETQRQRTAVAADKLGSAVEASELLRLREEVGLLRRQLASTAAKAQTTTNQIQFNAPYLPRAVWSDQGTDTPGNTIQTMFRAIGQGDQNRLEQIVSRFKDSQSLDELTFPKQDWDKIAAVQFVNVVRIHMASGEDQANVNALVERVLEGGTKDVSIQLWTLKKTNDQWLITGLH
jgi:hypothetical protein